MGTQATDPEGRNYDKTAEGHPLWMPPNEVELDPFFLSKYEMNQAQWVRVMKENPSKLPPGSENGLRTPSASRTSPPTRPGGARSSCAGRSRSRAAACSGSPS